MTTLEIPEDRVQSTRLPSTVYAVVVKDRGWDGTGRLKTLVMSYFTRKYAESLAGQVRGNKVKRGWRVESVEVRTGTITWEDAA